MNLWDYFEQELQKSGCAVNCMAKIAKATGDMRITVTISTSILEQMVGMIHTAVLMRT